MQVEIYRGGSVESKHEISACVVNARGEILFHNHQSFSFFPRSAVKPLQSHLLLQSGAFKDLNLGLEELALASSSHSGEGIHTNKVTAWLQKLNLNGEALACGAHWPYDENTADAMKRQGQTPTRIHNNCSGKHSGFLSVCKHHGIDCKGYELIDHPLQQMLKTTMESLVGHSLTKYGIDGCSIPAFEMDFFSVAKAFATAAKQAHQDSQSTAGLVFQAFQRFPELTSGTQEYCYYLMDKNQRKILVKEGAEGVLVAAIPELELAILVKAQDGADRASQAAMDHLIEKFGKLRPAQDKTVHNWAGLQVGEIKVRL